MQNALILKRLHPLQPGGNFNGIIAAHGAALDKVAVDIEAFLNEIVPTKAYSTIEAWEHSFGLSGEGKTLAERREQIAAKQRELGGLSRQRFIDLAAWLGQDIIIVEHTPTRCGAMACGDELSGDETIQWVWTVKGLKESGDFARCGELCCGEALSYVRSSIEDIFEQLKPAHTVVVFDYSPNEDTVEKTSQNLAAGIIPSEFTVASSVNWELYAKGIKKGTYGELKAYAATKPTVPFLCIATLDNALQLMFYVGDPTKDGTDDGFIILAGGAATMEEMG